MNAPTKYLLRLQAVEFPVEQYPLIDKRKAKLLARIRRLRSRLSTQILHQYDHRKVHFGGHSIVPIENGICSGCRVFLSQRTLRDSFYHPTDCEHCGRLVYNPARRHKRIHLEVYAA